MRARQPRSPGRGLVLPTVSSHGEFTALADGRLRGLTSTLVVYTSEPERVGCMVSTETSIRWPSLTFAALIALSVSLPPTGALDNGLAWSPPRDWGLLLALANESRGHVELRPTGKVLARTSDRFFGVTPDLWRADDAQYGAKWGNASALSLALTSRLANLVKALGPAVMRIGGSPQDSLVYQPRGDDCPTATSASPSAASASAASATSASTSSSGSSSALGAPYYCSQVRPPVYDCLTTSRWEALSAVMSAYLGAFLSTAGH